MSSSGWVRLLGAKRVEVGDEMAAHAVHVDELLDSDGLVGRRDRRRRAARASRVDVDAPPRRLVRDGEALEDVVVELLAPEKEVVHDGEEATALRARDDTVVVRARQGDRLADA